MDVSAVTKSSTSFSAANSAASAAKKGLCELRSMMCQGDVDVERAASSIVGKLIGLGMVRVLFFLSSVN